MKLMVVDDNKQIREGISQGICWGRYGIREVRAYGDGQEAKKELPEFQPDIVIADIRMPNMDGLALLEEVRRYSKSCRYILLSAYSDFTYAQKAIHLGANDYILKPVKPQKLIDLVMKNLKALLERKKEDQAYYDVYEKSFLHTLQAEGTLEHPEKLKIMMEQKYHLTLDTNRAILGLIRIERTEQRDRKTPVLKPLKEQILQELRTFGYGAELQNGQLLFLKKGELSQLKNQELRIELKCRLADLNRNLQMDRVALTGGISQAQGLQNLPSAFRQAQKAMELTYYQEAGSCILYGETRKAEFVFGETQQKAYIEEIRRAVQRHNKEEINKQFHLLLKEGMERQYPTTEAVSFFRLLYHDLLRHGGIKGSLEFEQEMIENSTHFAVTIQELQQYINQFMDGCSPLQEEQYSAIIRNICAYLDEHFKETLSVELIGERFRRTPNYISAKFKREVGKSFTDYLIELRVQKAVNMLMYTDLSIGEVAKESGFGSYAYFSRIFRKYTGKSAGTFREEKIKK